MMRSIPACAGEPGCGVLLLWLGWVYPRVCGGTVLWDACHAGTSGLYPRVRGNRVPPPALMNLARSIPACAGEPNDEGAPRYAGWVYPRVCGGT